MKTFGKIKCPYCGKTISLSGFARISHYRKHVREGLLYEIPKMKNGDFVDFARRLKDGQ